MAKQHKYNGVLLNKEFWICIKGFIEERTILKNEPLKKAVYIPFKKLGRGVEIKLIQTSEGKEWIHYKLMVKKRNI
jgi:hypothetical protein